MSRDVLHKTRLLTAACLAASLMLGPAGCGWVRELHIRPQLSRAHEAFEDGDYLLAASRYESLHDRFPEGPRKQQMLYRRGVALYSRWAYHEARNAFVDYLKDYPEGEYAADARHYLEKIEFHLGSNNPVAHEALEAAQTDLNALLALLKKHPTDGELLTRIGDAYYALGQYDDAGRYYERAVMADAVAKETLLKRQRMMVNAEGELVPVTPQELERIEREREPLVVFNTQSYVSRDTEDFNLDRTRFYNVTGMVRNQGSKLIRDVEVEVRFFNRARQMLDVDVVRVGSLAPNEIRSFRAEADKYDNLFNITDYACIPRGTY